MIFDRLIIAFSFSEIVVSFFSISPYIVVIFESWTDSGRFFSLNYWSSVMMWNWDWKELIGSCFNVFSVSIKSALNGILYQFSSQLRSSVSIDDVKFKLNPDSSVEKNAAYCDLVFLLEAWISGSWVYFFTLIRLNVSRPEEMMKGKVSRSNPGSKAIQHFWVLPKFPSLIEFTTCQSWAMRKSVN